jgi:hypothetical protein
MNPLLKNVPYTIIEQVREYTYPGGDKILLENVSELIVSDSGTHRLKTVNKELHIMPVGWIHIRIVSNGEWIV